MSENQRAFFRIDVAVPAVVRRLDTVGEAWDELGGETIDRSAGGVLFDELPRADRVAIDRLVIAEERKQRRLSA